MLATASIPKLSMASATRDVMSSSKMKGTGGCPEGIDPPAEPGANFTFHTSATARTLGDPETELTNLGWLQKPGVLSSMCTTLTGTPQQHSKPGARTTRRPRQPKHGGCIDNRSNKGTDASRPPKHSTTRTSDKMVNVILNVRNRKYNGEDARKPPLSFACMIFMAVESSPTKTLPVKDIYDWVMWKFPYYRNAPPGWKNSVRHNLSLNKCFKKVERYSGKSGSAVSKGGLWTVDPDYRRSLLAALKRSPYHPYHSYFTPPLSPSSSSSSLDSVDPAERDAALTMCMISGSGDETSSDLLHAILHDHCYTKHPFVPTSPSPPSSPLAQVTVKLRTFSSKKKAAGLTLDEIAAAAEIILAQEDEDDDSEEEESESSDEGFGGEVESDLDDAAMETEGDSLSEELCDSGYGPITGSMETSSALDEMGADALLCLATGSRGSSPPVP